MAATVDPTIFYVHASSKNSAIAYFREKYLETLFIFSLPRFASSESKSMAVWQEGMLPLHEKYLPPAKAT